MSDVKIIPITDKYRANYERIFNKHNTPDASVSSAPTSLRDAWDKSGDTKNNDSLGIVTYNPNPERILISGNPFSDHWIGWVL